MSSARSVIARLSILCICLGIAAQATMAAITVPGTDQSQVDVTVETDVQFDSTTNLYTYSYTLTNGPAALLEVQTFQIEADAELINIEAPEGWIARLVTDRPRLDWTAIGFIDNTIPPDDDGNIFPSDFNIRPGETLGGFSFQSPEPPTTVTFFAQGFAKIPAADSEDDFEGTEIPTFEENSLIDATIGPGLDDGITFAGGRRPSVDGFLGFVGVTNRITLSAPVTLVIRLAVNDETVDTSTFSATLNQLDVTDRFQATGNGDEMIAQFDLANSPLETGRNVLRTTVDGIVPGTDRTAADGDALTFFIE